MIPIPQNELLSSAKLRLHEQVRRADIRGTVMLRSPGGERRLVLTAAQAAILTDGFAQPRTVPEVLARVLGEQRCPPLNDYYELVLQAHAAGVLRTGREPTEYSLARRWPLRLPPRAAEIGGAILLLASLAALPFAAWRAPATGRDWLIGWLIACALLSVGEILAACAIAGGGGEVRDARWRWLTLLPHFCLDMEEAMMGGRGCELATAILRTVPVAAGAAVCAWERPDWLAPLLAGLFYALAPWRGRPAWQWLNAFRRTPRFSVRAGFLFAPRRDDAWEQWRAWWKELDSKFGLLWVGWIGLLALSIARCLPGVAVALPGWFGRAGKLHPLGNAAIYALVAAIAIACLALPKMLISHWWRQRQAARPLREDAGRGRARAALQGNMMAVLRQIGLFQGLSDDDLIALAEVMQPLLVEKQQDVFHEDDAGDAFYVVLEGELEILKRRPKPARRSDAIGWLGPGSGFGEIALLEGTPRTATVRATAPGRLLRLTKTDFERLVVDRVGAARVRERLQHAAFLGRLVFLAGWPFEELVRYAERCRSVRFGADVRVLRRGEPNIWFYLVYDGAFEAREGERVLRRMRPGDYFGEISLLENGVATADVVTLEESRCLTLARADFLEFFARDFRIGLRMEALAARRLGTPVFVSH